MARRPEPSKPAAGPNDPEPRHNPFAALKGLVPPGPPESPAPAAKKPLPRPIVRGRVTVRRESKGHGGKAVTIAEGPGLVGLDLEELAREVARALGAGSRVDGQRLLVQGEQPDRLVAWLEARGFAAVARGN